MKEIVVGECVLGQPELTGFYSVVVKSPSHSYRDSAELGILAVLPTIRNVRGHCDDLSPSAGPMFRVADNTITFVVSMDWKSKRAIGGNTRQSCDCNAEFLK